MTPTLMRRGREYEDVRPKEGPQWMTLDDYP